MIARLLAFGFFLSSCSALPHDFSSATSSSSSYSSSSSGGGSHTTSSTTVNGVTTYYSSSSPANGGGAFSSSTSSSGSSFASASGFAYASTGEGGGGGGNNNAHGSIGGRYYVGENKHDAYNSDQFHGVPEAEVHLIDVDSHEKVAGTYTNHDGYYNFDDVEANEEYYLFFINPEDLDDFGHDYEWVTSGPDTSNKVVNHDGETDHFSLHPGVELNDMDAGIYCKACLEKQEKASIEGRYFIDTVGNGHESALQPGASAAVIWLFDNTKWEWSDVAFTDRRGDYHFDGVDAQSTYTIYAETPRNAGLGNRYTWNTVTRNILDNKIVRTDRTTGFGKTQGFTCGTSAVATVNIGVHPW